ncbi:hypothetical protein FQZ97_699520 [compost metagenome]
MRHLQRGEDVGVFVEKAGILLQEARDVVGGKSGISHGLSVQPHGEDELVDVDLPRENGFRRAGHA